MARARVVVPKNVASLFRQFINIGDTEPEEAGAVFIENEQPVEHGLAFNITATGPVGFISDDDLKLSLDSIVIGLCYAINHSSSDNAKPLQGKDRFNTIRQLIDGRDSNAS